MYTRLHGFKFNFRKFSGGGLTEPPPQTPPRSISGCALDSGFALNTRTLRALGPRFGLPLNSPLPKLWPGCAFGGIPPRNPPRRQIPLLWSTPHLVFDNSNTGYVDGNYLASILNAIVCQYVNYFERVIKSAQFFFEHSLVWSSCPKIRPVFIAEFSYTYIT